MGMKRIPATVTLVAFFVAVQIIIGIRRGAPVGAIVIASVGAAITVLFAVWFVSRITGLGK